MALLVGLVLPSPVRRGGPAVGPGGVVTEATKEGAEAVKGPGGVPVVMVKGTQRKGVRVERVAVSFMLLAGGMLVARCGGPREGGSAASGQRSFGLLSLPALSWLGV